MKKKPLVIVSWLDAYGRSGWSPRPHFENNSGIPVVSVGWLFQRDKKGITLVSGLCSENDQGVALQFIPHGMIHKVVTLPSKYAVEDSYSG